MKRYLCAIFVVSFIFSSCTVLDRKSTIYYNEDELSLSDITEMRHVLEETEKIFNPKGKLVPYTDDEIESCVYWTKNGKVWHLTPECGYFTDGVEIIYGSEENAVECGKQRVCLLCEKNN